MNNFKSDEERMFSAWLIEAMGYGMISDVNYQPESYLLSEKETYPVTVELKTKTRVVEKHLLSKTIYTADWDFIINYTPLLRHFIKMDGHKKVVVDTKGTYQKYGGDKLFSTKQRWVFQQHGVYVNKVVPKKLFHATWVPEAWRLTPKTRKPAKDFIGCRNITEYLTLTKK